MRSSPTPPPLRPLPPPRAAMAAAALPNRLPITWERMTRFASTRCDADGKEKAIDAVSE